MDNRDLNEEVDKRTLTNDEVKDILDSGNVEHRLVADEMSTKNNVGRTITVEEGSISKRSGGIMISSKDVSEDSYQGVYYSLEEVLTAVNKLVDELNEIESSEFERKTKFIVDTEGLDEALVKFAILKVQREQEKKQGFHTISRSDEESEDFKVTGGAITEKDKSIKEDTYVPEDFIKSISLIEIPSEEEIKEAIEEIPTEEPVESEIERKPVPNDLREKLKKYAKRASTVLLIPILSSIIVAGTVEIIDEELPTPPPRPTEYVQEELERMVAENEENHDLEIGDVVVLGDGEQYYHNSEENDGLSGTIGDNGIREEGEYTVDVIAIHDEDGNLVAYTYDRDGSLSQLLEDNGYSTADIESGKITASYNLIEGIEKDVGIDKEADRAKAAGWKKYNQDTYNSIGNVIHDNSIGGKSI